MQKWIKRSIALSVFLFMAWMICSIAINSASEWGETKPFVDALKQAKSVTLEEFFTVRDGGRSQWREIALQRRQATPAEIQSLIKAASFHLIVSSNKLGIMCYNPHHRIEIQCADGTEFTLTICFECLHYEFNNEGPRLSPQPWSARLYSFFESAGMSPRSEEQYREIGKKMTGSDSIS